MMKYATRKAAKEELERVIQQMQEESMKVNTNLKVQEKAIQVYREEMEQQQTPTKLSQPFSPVRHFEFGEVRECELDYSIKKQPVLPVWKKRKGDEELFGARGLALDEPNELIYIVDRGNNRIQVVSFTGKFLERFGRE